MAEDTGIDARTDAASEHHPRMGSGAPMDLGGRSERHGQPARESKSPRGGRSEEGPHAVGGASPAVTECMPRASIFVIWTS